MTPDLPPPPAELNRDPTFLATRLTPPQLLALIDAFGGARIHIPKSPSQGSPLSRAIGHAGAQALAAAMGGEDLSVPLARHWHIRCLHAEGLSYRAIAHRLRITESAVYRNLHAARLTHAQGDLFA